MKYKWKILIFICAIIIIIAHIMGYKIYGKVTKIRNQPLSSPQTFQSIDCSGQITLYSGEKYKLYGITMIISIPFDDWDTIEEYRTSYRSYRRTLKEIHSPRYEIEIETPESEISRVWYKEPIRHINSDVIRWHSLITKDRRFFPRKIPRFCKGYFAKLLVRDGIAVPDVNLFEEDLEYAKELISSINNRNIRKINVVCNRDEVIKLGKYLCEKQPELFNHGAWLLANSDYSETFNLVKIKIDEILSTNKSSEVLDLIDILIKTSPEDSKNILHEIIETKRDPYLRLQCAIKLFNIRDLYGLDFLMEEVDPDNRTVIAGYLHNKFPYGKYFSPSNYQEMYEWYRENRLYLQYDDVSKKFILQN